MRAVNKSSGTVLAGRVVVAKTPFSRMKGLLGRRSLPGGEGLLIKPCKGVHTFLMKFPIDVLFLDKNNRIIEAVQDLQPYRMTKVWFSAVSAIEVPAGTVLASKSVIGDEIILK